MCSSQRPLKSSRSCSSRLQSRRGWRLFTNSLSTAIARVLFGILIASGEVAALDQLLNDPVLSVDVAKELIVGAIAFQIGLIMYLFIVDGRFRRNVRRNPA